MSESTSHFEEDEAFEAEVIAVARALFAPDRPFQGAGVLDGQERDGIFHGEDAVILVEATTSRRLDKAQKDGRKLKQACEEMARKHRFKAVKAFFVTRDEPTAEQRRFIESLDAPIVACSLVQLRSMIIDSRDYLNVRADNPFGSARNPGTGSSTDLDNYVPIALLSARVGAGGSSFSVDDLVARTQNGLATVLLGDFGAGKSMTMREVHLKLTGLHLKDSGLPFPMTLNLRDHQGQREPDEAIRRHAAIIGFDSPTRLVRAWRAGRVHVLLDGFDEIATTGWLGKASNLAQIRRASVELIRKLADQTPSSAGFLISGRRHFFDSESEMLASLGVKARSPEIALTDQFSEPQVREYLRAHGWDGLLPDWLPSHPLLLGYLAARGALQQLTSEEAITAQVGWDMLLDRVCEREAQMELGLDGATIRRVLERLATFARGRTDGVGPIYQNDLAIAFEQIAGYPPNEGSYVVLQRMPGLGVQEANEGSRYFIDQGLVDAARAGDIVRYITAKDNAIESLRGSLVPQRRLGVGVSTLLAERAGVVPAQANAAAKRLQQRGGRDAIAFDIVRVGVDLGPSSPDTFQFRELEIDELAFDDANDDLGLVTFVDCVVEKLDLTEYDGQSPLPYFENCDFGTVEGAASVDGLPSGRFVNCTFAAFDPSAKTTRGILGMPGLSPRQKVLLTVLKKTYAQAGSGRKESALHRGLDGKLRALVPEVLELLVSSQLLVRGRAGGNTLFYPVRGHTIRVRRILETGAATSDELVLSCR